MKKLLLLLVVAMLASCSQVPEDKVNATAGVNTISVDIPQTRTALGGKNEDGFYSVYWSAEDKLVTNGAPSTAITIGEGGSSAQFTYEIINAPFKLTYPYTEGSLCSGDRPTVVFAAEQNYAEGTFGVGYAPMCGYNEGLSTTVLKHLAGVLRISLTGSTTLSKIEIVAADGVALAGEFDVDCQTGDITPIEGTISNKVTYVANQGLSEVEKSFFVVVPKGNLGTCKVILTDNGGSHMNLTWNGKDVKGGIVREFKPFAFQVGVSFELGGLPAEDDEVYIPEPNNSEIWYTSSNDAVVTPNSSAFDANIVSNTYVNGMGVITFDAPITTIGYSAFHSCENLESVTLSNAITQIGDRAFQECPKLSAFYGNLASADSRCVILDGVLEGFAPAGLTEYTIPDGVTAIGDYVFAHCPNLTSVTIPDTVAAVGCGSFAGCSSLSAFYGKYVASDNRCLIIDNELKSFAPAGLNEYSIPDGVTSIGGWAFAYCYTLASVTIPARVTSIGDAAFGYCESLTAVKCKPTTPPTIGNMLFHEANSALVIYVPASSNSRVLNAYKTANNWSAYQDRIQEEDGLIAVEDMTGETETGKLEF